MKLTRLQRHTAYILMLAEVQELQAYRFDCFLCVIITDYIRMICYDDVTMIKVLPELKKYKPKRNHEDGGWFGANDYDKRINILSRCIAETY